MNVSETAAPIAADDFAAAMQRFAGWLVFISFATVIFWKGVLPALLNSRGDFANYYTAARLVADGQPLEHAYRDFVWFQKQIDRYGISRQLGGFIPHPPATALVMLPLTCSSRLSPKVWIGLNLPWRWPSSFCSRKLRSCTG
jgi:hypothetical protein